MSKVDAQRAMREAKYARNNASGPTRREAAAAQGTSPAPTTAPEAGAPGTAKPVKAAKPAKAPKAAAKVADAAPAPQGELCGHRSMNGRSCTREAGHAEKNHRYG